MYKDTADHRRADPAATHKIQMLLLAIIYISLFSCLIRSDYNFVFAFFCYFLWQQNYSPMAPQISLAAIAISIVFDILFSIIEIPTWTAFNEGNPIWQTLSGMHNFGIFCFVVILIVKLILGFFLFKRSKVNQTV